MATGNNEKSKDKVKELFGLQSTNRTPLIALCSDAMSEGINLPDAKALVLLDMPSVLRIIEQRIGRLERMDSEHDEIHIFWPDDSEEYSLKGDKRILDIVIMTEDLIGGNVVIPRTKHDRHLADAGSAKKAIQAYEEYEEKDEEWGGVKDNTQSLYNLMEGPNALITLDLYKEFSDVDESVKTAISFVETEKNFSFFAFRGDAARSPKWLFIDERNNSFTDFDVIARKLVEYLKDEPVISRKWKEVNTDTEIKAILKKLRLKEKDLLPFKKRQALSVGQKMLKEITEDTVQPEQRKTLARRLLAFFDTDADSDEWIDYNHFAELWLSILLPALDKLRNQVLRKRKIITLLDLKLNQVTLNDEDLLMMLENCQYASTLEQLVASCIIGIPKKPATNH